MEIIEKNNNKQLVSVIIPTFNRKEMLTKAIDSVLEQDYKNIEIIVSDNASEDGTHLLMKEYTQKHKNIIYIRREENIGAHKNGYNAYKDYAKGEYIYFLSDDDYFLGGTFIRKAVDVFINYPTVAIVTGITELYFEKNNQYTFQIYHTEKLIDGIDYLKNHTTQRMPSKYSEIISGFCLIKKKDLDKNKTFEWFEYGDVSIRYYHLLFGDVYFLNELIACYNIHNNNKDSLNFEKTKKQLINVCNFIDVFTEDAATIKSYNKNHLKNFISQKIADNLIVDLFKREIESKIISIEDIYTFWLDSGIKKINPVVYNFVNEKCFKKLKNGIKQIEFSLFAISKYENYFRMTIFGISLTIKLKK